jgi:F0F1-type ATP synthase assembly protein I
MPCSRIDIVQNVTKSVQSRKMPKQDQNNWMKLAGAGMEIAVGLGLGAVIGNWIDRKYQSAPWGVLIGAGLGFAAGMYLLIKATIGANKN